MGEKPRDLWHACTSLHTYSIEIHSVVDWMEIDLLEAPPAKQRHRRSSHVGGR